MYYCGPGPQGFTQKFLFICPSILFPTPFLTKFVLFWPIIIVLQSPMLSTSLFSIKKKCLRMDMGFHFRVIALFQICSMVMAIQLCSVQFSHSIMMPDTLHILKCNIYLNFNKAPFFLSMLASVSCCYHNILPQA